MRRTAWWVASMTLLCAIAGAGPAATESKPRPRAPFDYQKWKHDQAFRSRVFARAHVVRPARRDEPLRELNISDDEVREIQQLTRQMLPRSLVNISAVVTGCPCEEGPQCTDQVYILASRGDITRGLQLSRVRNAWTVGMVQRWWLEYEALENRDPALPWDEYEDALTALAQKFPQCVGELVPARGTASIPQPAEKK